MKCTKCGCYYSGGQCHICHDKATPKKKPGKIDAVSKTNSLRCSDGKRITRINVERNLKEAKHQFRVNLMATGKYHCAECGPKNGVFILDVSHIVSVNDCYTSGKAEQAFNEENMEMLCRSHHNAWENQKIMNPKRKLYITTYFPELLPKYKDR